MRLTLGLLAAIGLHAALFGVAAAFLSHSAVKPELPAAIEVEVPVLPPRPEPIDDSAPGPAPAKPTPPPPRPHVAHHVREIALREAALREAALIDGSITIPAALAPAAAAPTAVSAAAPPTSPSHAPASAVHAAPQGGGAVISAQPRYHTNPKPDYPLPSLRRREEGIVLLNVQVQADGTPSAISLNHSCGHPLLDRAALDAVRRWTFEPARAAGVPVSSLVVIPVRFSLDDR